jgi:hypothetical protein
VSEWPYLRAGLAAVALLVVAALVGWGIQEAVYEDRAFERTRQCLESEKLANVQETRDPIARSAELGALRTVIETNGVTVSVAGSRAGAERLAGAYRSVAGDLGERLELRGRTVYLWDREPSPTQRQTLFDCTY